jgi:hypothetical protein
MEQRPICPTCNTRPVAVNYIKEGVTHYRKQCDSCLRKGKKLKPKRPAWALSGYKKKPQCEKCGFSAKHPDQLQVFHLDGKLNNTNWTNLKTICANCAIEVSKSKLPWKTSTILPDF